MSKCGCGKRSKCPNDYWIQGAGILCVNSNKLVQCERVKTQIEEAHKMMEHKDTKQ